MIFSEYAKSLISALLSIINIKILNEQLFI